MEFQLSYRKETLNFHNLTAVNVKNLIEYVLNIVKFQFSCRLKLTTGQQKKNNSNGKTRNGALHVNQYK